VCVCVCVCVCVRVHAYVRVQHRKALYYFKEIYYITKLLEYKASLKLNFMLLCAP